MKRLILKKRVTVEGRNIFGLRAFIEFSPTHKPGWHWQSKPEGEPLPISAELARNKFRRLVLADGYKQLGVWEHIGSLRFTGLDGIVIKASANPPYFGRPLEFWQELKPWCEPDGNYLPWRKVAAHRFKRNGSRHMQMYPMRQGKDGLEIDIIIDYPGLGKKDFHFRLPEDDLEPIFEAYTIAFPTWLRWLANLWPHRGKINWPKNMPVDDLLTRTAEHRLGDLLGDLSLSVHTGLPSGCIHSRCAGHKLDLDLVKSLRFTE